MQKSDLIDLLNKDLANERKHLAFYLHSSVMVEGRHREEFKEFFLNEAKSELEHVHQFSELIVHLGGVPSIDVAAYPTDLTNLDAILMYVVQMEQDVADNYAQRLLQTDPHATAVGELTTLTYVHLFYEDQLQDSMKTALEVRKMLPLGGSPLDLRS